MEAHDFPLWLRINHFINLFCIFLLMRSGLQILADHPKLYWNDHCMPDTEWIKFGKKKMPKDRLFTSMDEAEDVSPVFALPGGHHRLGAGRNWHFLIVPVWVLNGLTYVTLLAVTGQWRRLLPTDLHMFKEAWQSALTFASLHVPPESQFDPYDPLQQLVYAAMVFGVAPVMVATGICQSPAFIARFPWYPKLFGGRQAARSLHFLGLMAFVGYTIVHLTMVVLVHFPHDLGHMFGSPHMAVEVGTVIASVAVLSVLLFHVGAVVYTRWSPRGFQEKATAIIEPWIRFVFGHLHSHQAYRKSDITPQHHVNGYPPESKEYRDLAADRFKGWALRVEGLVEHPHELTLTQLHALPKEQHIAKHNCIQGWTSIAEWGGVPVSVVLDLCRPKPNAKWIVFHAFMQGEYEPDHYYEAFPLWEMYTPQTILAYEMNWEPLPLRHGAPLRLRIETKVGYKMVKYLKRIELVESLEDIGLGHGGYREDHQYYDKVASI